MTKPLVLRAAAEADIEDAFHWYEAQNPGLGVEFLRAVEASGEPRAHIALLG